MVLSSDTPFSVGGYYKSTHTINYISNVRCSLELKKYKYIVCLYCTRMLLYIDRCCHCPFALLFPSAPKERLSCSCCTHFYSMFIHGLYIWLVTFIQKKNVYSCFGENILPRRRRLSRTLGLLAGCCV